jgi:hypothetical protein
MLGRLGQLFTRRISGGRYAGLLTDWSVCEDVGGCYFRGAMEDDLLGRFRRGERMSTGYVLEGPDEQGCVRATDGLYRLDAFPDRGPADTADRPASGQDLQ